MFFEIDENLTSRFNADELPEIDRNKYISDSGKAVELISSLLDVPRYQKKYDIKNIKKKITELFSLFSDDSINNKLEYFKRFMVLCDRLSERQKLKKIGSKTVIGVGGKFSAGKSKFINSIAGLDGLLPEATSPTTSIPTYILNAAENSYTANNVFGKEYSLSKEQLQAITHEFHDVYKVGFSSFVESIVIGSRSWKLDADIVLLDTPGYNKYDNKSVSHISDNIKAREQLKITDYLIWLADVDNGTIVQEDIEFIEALNISTPILIVLNKCENKTDRQINDTLDEAANCIENTCLKCFGAAAYSSLRHKEYASRAILGKKSPDGYIINDFFRYAAGSHTHGYDLKRQLHELENELLRETESYKAGFDHTTRDLENFICNSENITNIKSLSQIWSFSRRKNYDLFTRLHTANSLLAEINKMIDSYFEGEKR